jgi:hypothetical protein
MRAPSTHPPARLAAAALAALLALTACGGAPTPSGRVLDVTLAPGPTHTVPVGSDADFTATVQVEGAIDASVSWNATCGSVDGDGDGAAVFTAPLPPIACTVTATSVADPTRAAATVVTADSGPPGVLRHAAQFGGTGGDWVNGIAPTGPHTAVLVGSTNADLAPGDSHLGGQDAFVAWFDARLPADERVTRIVQCGTPEADLAHAVAVDASGAVWMAGSTIGTLPGQTAAGNRDAFVARFGPDGALDWVQQFGTIGADFARGIALDGEGNAVVVGPSDGGRPFLRRFGSDGSDLGSAVFGPTNASPKAVAVDPDGRIAVAGSSARAFPDEDGADGFGDAFVALVNLDGTIAWSRTYPAAGTPATFLGVGVADDGRVVAAGYTTGTLPGEEPIAGNAAAFVVGLDADGTELWRGIFDTDGRDDGYAVAVDGSGHALVAGSVGGDLFGDAVGSDDAFVAKLDPDGDVVWARAFGTAGADYALAIAADAGWSVWVGGTTLGDLDAAQQGNGDPFVRSYTP